MISIYEMFGPIDDLIDEMEGDIELCQDNLEIAAKEARALLKDCKRRKTLTATQEKALRTILTCVLNVHNELEDLMTEDDDDDEEDLEIEIEET